MKNKDLQRSAKRLFLIKVGTRILLFITTLVFLSMPLASFAELGGLQNGVFSVAPHLGANDDFIRSWITYKASAGANIQDAIDVQNLTNTDLQLSLDTADAANADPAHFALKGPDEPHQLLGQWLQFKDTKTITLKANAIQTVPLNIIVPESIRHGDYWGGVTIEETDQSFNARIAAGKTQTPAPAIGVKIRLAIRTLVRITTEKNARTERLLIGTKPWLKDEGAANFFQQLKNLTLFGKIYVAMTAIYFTVYLLWLSYEVIRRRQKIRKLLRASWLNGVANLALITGLLLYLPFGSAQNIFTSVLNTGARGLSIMPVPIVNEAGNITEKPSWFIFKGASGETIHGKATVKNNDDTAVDVMVYPVDGTVTDQGGFALEPKDQAQNDIGKWLIVAEPNFRLNGQEQKEVNFTMQLPDNLEPGDHAGGLIAQVDPNGGKQNGQGSSGVSLTARIAVRVYLTAEGEAKLESKATDFKITAHDDETSTFDFTFKNTGNVRFKPTINLKLKDENGKKVGDNYQHPQNVELLPGKTVKMSILLPWKDLDPGTYQLNASINDSKKTTDQTLDWVIETPHAAAPKTEQPVEKPVEVAPPPPTPVTAPASTAAPVVQVIGSEIPPVFYLLIGGVFLILLILIIILLIFLTKKRSNETPAIATAAAGTTTAASAPPAQNPAPSVLLPPTQNPPATPPAA